MKLILSTQFQKDLKELLERSPSLQAKIIPAFGWLLYAPHFPAHRVSRFPYQQTLVVNIDLRYRLLCTYQPQNIYCLRIATFQDIY